MSAPLRRIDHAPPVRMAHLGLGNFFRAHQAWYTELADDGDEWGIAAFTGRRPGLADALRPQDGLYTLVTRGTGGDEFRVVRTLARVHAATEHDAWLDVLASPDVRIVTTTVTEAGYLRGTSGGLDSDNPRVRADAAALRHDPSAPVTTAPGKLVAGLLARRRAGAGALTLIPCDNLPGNGDVLARVLDDLAGLVDPSLREWTGGNLSTATTMVDRITPGTTDADRHLVRSETGVDDRCPVVTEPFTEWVLAGSFPGGRPAWETAGALLAADVTPYEERKLWLLNGAHSLLAYAGSMRGHHTVAEAVADDMCLGWVEQWWDTCTRYLQLPADRVAGYRDALLVRFTNPRIRHALEQIAADGSQKLPARILPVLRLERAAGRVPEAVVVVLAAWVLHLRGRGVPVQDVRSAELQPLVAGSVTDAVPRVLGALDPELGDDAELVAAVRACAEGLA